MKLFPMMGIQTVMRFSGKEAWNECRLLYERKEATMEEKVCIYTLLGNQLQVKFIDCTLFTCLN